MKRIILALALAFGLAGQAAAAGFVGLVGSDGVTAITGANPLPVNQVIGVAVNGASGNKANATATATLAGVAGKTTYITGFQCTAAGATAALAVSATVSDGTWTQTYAFVYPTGAAVQATPLIVTFPIPVPATAANTAITVTLPASGAGGTNAACNAQGYQL